MKLKALKMCQRQSNSQEKRFNIEDINEVTDDEIEDEDEGIETKTTLADNSRNSSNPKELSSTNQKTIDSTTVSGVPIWAEQLILEMKSIKSEIKEIKDNQVII